ncbi:ATP-binding cassette domain-containing protein [Saccharospirillum mangrovi]|uniref:ATP-binding cassette domain-containing protein n=1 Tax=Saccharospirillum mangrovi TaxID=2161747 RepID=UPI000E1FBFBB|nr:ATP-binding cassette domain-containing protein [Saccharospirillum mangrovi]
MPTQTTSTTNATVLGHLHQLTLSFDGEPLFADLSASFQPGLTGLVGRNGQGKSVLMSVLAGVRAPTSGRVHWSVPIQWLDQLDRLDGPRLADALGVSELFDTFARVDAGKGSPDDLDRLADRWLKPAQWQAVLDRAGLSQSLDAPIEQLSGGERTRLALCRLLLHPDHYLLLDEPTNHLDADGRTWLMDALAQHPGGALIVSHDRSLLRRVSRILELSPQGLTEFGGNVDHYQQQRDLAQQAAEARAERLAAEQKQLQRAQQAELQKAAQRRRQGEQQRKGRQPEHAVTRCAQEPG